MLKNNFINSIPNGCFGLWQVPHHTTLLSCMHHWLEQGARIPRMLINTHDSSKPFMLSTCLPSALVELRYSSHGLVIGDLHLPGVKDHAWLPQVQTKLSSPANNLVPSLLKVTAGPARSVTQLGGGGALVLGPGGRTSPC